MSQYDTINRLNALIRAKNDALRTAVNALRGAQERERQQEKDMIELHTLRSEKAQFNAMWEELYESWCKGEDVWAPMNKAFEERKAIQKQTVTQTQLDL